MSSSKNLKCIWNCKCELGESVIWVREHNSIYFTDIKKKIVLYKYNKRKYDMFVDDFIRHPKIKKIDKIEKIFNKINNYN